MNCKLDCDEMYCETCGNNTIDLAEIRFMFAKKQYEDAVKQSEEIRTLLLNAIALEQELLREYQLSLEEKHVGI